MISNKEFVSRVVTGGRFLSKDSRISWRYVLSIGRIKAKFLLAQKWDELSLTREDSLKTNISCLKMKRVDSRSCGIVEFKLCDKLMRSCEKLPEGIFGKRGPSILSVMKIDGSKKFDYVTLNQWSRNQSRSSRYKTGDQLYYYVSDGYLYTPGSSFELLDVELITTDKIAARSLSSCTGQGSSNEEGSCSNWDSDFVCPDRLLDIVVRDTISEVANYYRTSIPDENPNMDEHQKTKTTN